MATPSSILAGESHGQRSLVGYSPWGHRVRHMQTQWAASLDSAALPLIRADGNVFSVKCLLTVNLWVFDSEQHRPPASGPHYCLQSKALEAFLITRGSAWVVRCGFCSFLAGVFFGFPGRARVKNLPAVQDTNETQIWSLGREDALEKDMATHSRILAWKIPGGGAWRATVHGITELDMTEVMQQSMTGALQSPVRFYCTAKWITYIYIYLCMYISPPFWMSFPFRSPQGT